MQRELVSQASDAQQPSVAQRAARPTQQDGALRAQRLLRLRAAAGAVTPSLGASDARRVDSFAQDLHDRLTAFGAALRSADAELLETGAAQRESEPLGEQLVALDVDLDRLAASLRLVLDKIPRAQLRAQLEQRGDADRNEVVALLDLVLEDEARIVQRSDAVLLLLLWASSEAKHGRRRVVRDPATLTPRLCAFAERCAAQTRVDLVAAEQDFVAAARRCEASPEASAAPAIEARRASLGSALFAPSVLRAAVFYEAILANAGVAPPAAAVALAVAAPVAEDSASAASSSNAVFVPPPPSTASPGAAAAATAAEPADVHWRIHDAAPEAPIAPPERGRARRAIAAHGMLVAKLAGMALLVGVAAHVWRAPAGTVRNLSKSELGAVSASLASAYRGDYGKGTLLVGTVGPEWQDYSALQREDDAKRIVATLSRSGVREVLLYDTARRVAVHHAEGVPLQIGP